MFDCRIGQRYGTARASLNATDGSHGIELLKSEPFVDPATGRKGTYTHKHYHIDGYLILLDLINNSGGFQRGLRNSYPDLP